jgi:hypothetical protein
MRVAGRLLQLERLEHALSDVQYQGNQASLPPDIVDLVRRYEQVHPCISTAESVPLMFFQVGTLVQAQAPTPDGGDSSFALFSLMLFLFMLSSWRRMRNSGHAPEYEAE